MKIKKKVTIHDERSGWAPPCPTPSPDNFERALWESHCTWEPWAWSRGDPWWQNQPSVPYPGQAPLQRKEREMKGQLSTDTQLQELRSEFNLKPWGVPILQVRLEKMTAIKEVRLAMAAEGSRKGTLRPRVPHWCWRYGVRVQDSRNLAIVSGSWFQQETGLLTLKPSLLSSGRWCRAWWWIKLPGRMGFRTRWWYQTLMR